MRVVVSLWPLHGPKFCPALWSVPAAASMGGSEVALRSVSTALQGTLNPLRILTGKGLSAQGAHNCLVSSGHAWRRASGGKADDP